MKNLKSNLLIFLVPLIICIGCKSNTKTTSNTTETKQPNIIVILTDDMGYADMDIQGSLDDLKTPHLNDLAETGVRMSAGYVTASQCMPSRAGLLSGRYQQRFGLDHNGTIPFPLEEEMIAQRMKDAGYRTGMSGKWHLEPNRNHHNWINKNIPEIAGREKYVDSDVPHNLKIPYLPNNKGFDFVHEGNLNQYWATHNVDGELIEPALINIPGYRLEVQTESAVTFIDKFKDEPFFYFLSYYAPHVPLDATEKYLSRFPGDMPERRRMCLAMIAAMDDGIGRIKETLRKNNIEENTLIIFLSDNGAPLKLHKKDLPLSFKRGAWNGSLNDPYIGEKGMVSEGGIRVPFIMNWPNGLPKGKVYDRPVSSLDIAATSLAIAGQKVPEELDGVNVIPYLNDEVKGDPHKALYWRFWQQSAIRVGDWKYLNFHNTEFLFNVYNDEHEHVNLFAKYPEKAKDLKEKLVQWGSELKHPGISMKDAPAPKQWLPHYFYESLPKE